MVALPQCSAGCIFPGVEWCILQGYIHVDFSDPGLTGSSIVVIDAILESLTHQKSGVSLVMELACIGCFGFRCIEYTDSFEYSTAQIQHFQAEMLLRWGEYE